MSKFSTKYGYFTDNGAEYVITSPRTPKPWVNVISNGNYGLVVSQTGGGFSWDVHSEFNRITRWHQDLIQDNWGKYIYIKNNKTGEVWSPTWQPVKTELDQYECRYGLGYAKFISTYKEITTELTLFVPFDNTIEIWDLKIHNNSKKKAELSLFTYFEWVLGSSNDYHREFHKLFLETKFDEKINGILANKRLWDIPLGDRGHWNIDYEYTGFFAANKKINSYEGDKESFLGNYGSLTNPKSIAEGKLSNTTGVYNDSIASLNINLTIEPNKTERVNFYLGLKKNKEEIEETVNKYSSFQSVDNALKEVSKRWNELLGDFEINTPDEALNFSVNKWFRHQAISGRLWGRTAYYQQSGAYGFRDQLQDSLVFLPIEPGKTKEQIKLHARHQFEDGTVLHWWHPISETGLQTQMTDDLLWLPFVVYQYIEETGDYSILDEVEPFYESNKNAAVFEHCIKAIDKVLSRLSERGLTLIGAGDWNDGLSAVGLEMKGESVWLTEFFYLVLNQFQEICNEIGRKEIAERLKTESDKLKRAFDEYAWDGDWFWRATKDSGEKLGSKQNEEGRIYLNAQTWSVISGIAETDKKIAAMKAVEKYLLKDNGCLLLYPAYTKPDKYIGYLSRYAAGRRENGGVYSHAAAWAVWAFALLKQPEVAFESCKRLCSIYSGNDPDKYAAEPYVMPGNIDGPDSPNYGMAGWTWYTGSASWFQKTVVDWILGIRASNKGLVVDPLIPKGWSRYRIKRKFRGTVYNIEVINDNHVSFGVMKIEIDGKEINGNVIQPQTKKECTVKVYLG
ncbi:cyclic beta-1,2-glucan synthase [hydrocarbon metagenome]|uniref:Cyclic beta-1,2-glucan synthase n=1 Tax=hydrocarbon metagenome TaxID=938273 RepID=A0A0W8G0K6_9ZZZZ